jgi:hypothetical protein
VKWVQNDRARVVWKDGVREEPDWGDWKRIEHERQLLDLGFESNKDLKWASRPDNQVFLQ